MKTNSHGCPACTHVNWPKAPERTRSASIIPGASCTYSVISVFRSRPGHFHFRTLLGGGGAEAVVTLGACVRRVSRQLGVGGLRHGC